MTDVSTNSKEDKLEATAKVRMLKTSPQKLNLVSRMIRNEPVNIALAQLKFSKKRIAKDVRKCLELFNFFNISKASSLDLGLLIN